MNCRPALFIFAIVTSLAGASCDNQGSAPAQGAGGTRPAVKVEAAQVRSGSFDRIVETIGTLRADEAVIVRPELAGRVTEIGFSEGERVEKGQLLIQLDASILKAELAEAEARLALSRANYERARELVEKGAASKRTFDEAAAELRRDEAAVQLAQARLDKTSIIAPFDGVTGLRHVSPGDVVSPGQELTSLNVVDPIKVDFRIPEIYLADVKEGQSLTFFADALPGQTFGASVYAIDPQIDINGRSLVIRAEAENPDMVLRPGLFVRIKLNLGTRANVLFVPEQALIPVGSDQYVFRIEDDGTVSRVRVTVGSRTGDEAEVTSGLRPGDRVVTAGQLKLRDGTPVEIRAQARAEAGDTP